MKETIISQVQLQQSKVMQCFAHTCSDEGDSPVVINRFCSNHRFCSHPISVHKF